MDAGQAGDIPLMRGRGKRNRTQHRSEEYKRVYGSGRPMRLAEFSSSSESIPSSVKCPRLSFKAGRSQSSFGFHRLSELAKLDGLKIMEILSLEDSQIQFIELCRKDQLKEDWIMLIIKVLSKLCTAEFHGLTATLLCEVCSHEFLNKLLLFIIGLDEDQNEHRRQSLNELFETLSIFFRGLLKLLPTLACERLGKLIQQTSLALSSVGQFDGQDHFKVKLKAIEEELNVQKDKRKKKTAPTKKTGEGQPCILPPNNFRELEVFPLVEDLVCCYKPYLRPVLKVGAFENVEHYLDVQFRLMREDFIRPLRQGLEDYKKKLRDCGNDCKKRFKVDNIRVYDKVEFIGMRGEEDRLCFELCFDIEKKMCTKINWEHSKRFMQGSLLILTKDNFESIILLTVAKRISKDLENGKILVESCENSAFKEVFEGQFLMVESQLFFGCYQPVLKALKEFEESNFPLKKYLVEASSESELPGYLNEANNSIYVLPARSCVTDNPNEGEAANKVFNVNIKDDESWPSFEALGLDESQHRALKGALTQKVMLVQGPPGTGKTFIGLKIVQSLLLNDWAWRSGLEKRPILVICYTNHALDQFLMGIKDFTNEIVRVGGGCKEPSLEVFCLNKLRKDRLAGQTHLYRMLRDHRIRFKKVKACYELVDRVANLIKSNSGIVSPETFVIHNVMLEEHLHSFESPEMFIHWLEEGFVMNNRSHSATFHSQGINYDTFVEALLECELEEVKETLQSLSDINFLLSFSKIEKTIFIYQKNNDFASQVVHEYLKKRVLFHKHQLVNPQNDPKYINWNRIGKLRSLWALQSHERWQLYRYWIIGLLQVLTENSKRLEPRYQHAANLLNEGRMVEEEAIMASKLVIGMTTSYAASRQSILKQLKPCIVIVEEAAEIFESHIVVSLTGRVQHFILIGDHQQLRPKPAVLEHATRYNLDISLFERLLNNKVYCVSLTTQHRMRPEIAKLISPVIYPCLKNHPSVESFPSVKGVTSDLVFVNHHHKEEEVKEIDSFKNTHEALFLTAFARYLILQGYDSSKITLLCAYKGQVFYLHKLRQQHPHLNEIRIVAVDNYQGEENDIVLLSLVRNNEENIVGFLKIENRVCVALSRARQGLFIIGNMDNLTQQGRLWPKVKEKLMEQNAMVEAMTLRCEIHSTLTIVRNAEDFFKCPEGGCLKQCGVLMSCGHACVQLCHSTDREHKDFKCMEPCERPLCPENHTCPRKCFQTCEPCHVPKTVVLPCGHSTEIPCYLEPQEFCCKVRVVVRLTLCDHENEIYCHQNNSLDLVKCNVPCPMRLPCGHACDRACHLLSDPQHEEYKCRKPCALLNHNCSLNHSCAKLCCEDCEECSVRVLKDLECGHKRTVKCSEAPSRTLCERKCRNVNPCGHPCSKRCKDECFPCQTKVLKNIPTCGHDQMMPCGEDPTSFENCGAKCDKPLPCGHKCSNICSQVCSATCQEITDFPQVAECGHLVPVPCHLIKHLAFNSVDLLKYCKQPCDTLLKCMHSCQGTCGKCLQGRFHEACKQKCSRTLVCGHPCKASCTLSCPPCDQPCAIECIHSKCPRRCGEPCAPCKESCPRKCAHKLCPRMCGQPCDMEPCYIPCAKKVRRCQHDCISFCGENCICRECNQEEVETIFFGFEEEKWARFVRLPDCSHIFESTGLERWIKQNDGQIKQMVCPRCTTPIMKCVRYDNKNHAEDIARVKLKLYGNFELIKRVATEAAKILGFQSNLSGFPQAAELLSEVKGKLSRLLATWPKGQKRWRTTPPLSLMEARNLKQYCGILLNVNNLVKGVTKSSSFKDSVQHKLILKEYRDEIKSAVNVFCGCLRKHKMLRLSEQEVNDINLEQERLSCLVAIHQIQSSPNFRTISSNSKIMFEQTFSIIHSSKPFPSEKKTEIKSNLDILLKEVYGTLGLSPTELRGIRSAIGLSQGHWFKCPNGHIYAIGECGGAMERGSCPECGKHIGGQQHRLVEGNALATEMDGAYRPAWPY